MRVRKPGFLNSVFQQNNKAQQHGLMMGDDESCAFSSDGMGAPPVNPRAGRMSHNEDGEDHDEDDGGDGGPDEQQQNQNGNEDAPTAASAPPEQAPAASGKQQGMKKTRAKSKRNLFALTQPVREEDNDDSPSGEGNKTASSLSSSPEASSAVEGTKKKEKKESSQSTKKETEAVSHSKKENAGKKPSTGEKKPVKKNKPKPKGAADAASAPTPQAQQQPPPAESVLSWSRQGATIARSALSAYTSSPRRTLNAIKPGGGAPAAPRFGLGIVGGRDKNHAKEQAQDDSAAAAETATRNVDSRLKVIPASAPLELKLKAAVTKRGGGEESASFVQFTIGQTDVEDAVSHVSDDAYSSSSSSSSSESSDSSESTQSIDSQLDVPVPRPGRRSAEPVPVKNKRKDTLSSLRDTTAATTGAAAAVKERRKEQSTSSRGSSYSDDGAGARKKEKSTDARPRPSSDVAKEKKKDGSMSSRGTSSFDNAVSRRSPPGKEKKKDSNTKPSPPAPSTSSTSQRSKDSSGHNYTEEFLMQSMLKALAEETGEDITELAKKAGLEKMRTTKATDKTSSTPPPPNEEDTHPDETGAATTIAKKREAKPQFANKAAQGCPNVSDSLPTHDTVDSMKKQCVEEKVHQHHNQHQNHHHNEPSKIQEAVGKHAASHNNDLRPLQVNGTTPEKDTISDIMADAITDTKIERMEEPVVDLGEAEPTPEYEEQDSPSDKKQDAAGKAVTSTPHSESVLLQVETNNSSNLIEPSIQGVDIDREKTAMKEAEGSEQNMSANEMAVVLTADLAVTGTRTRMKVDVVGDCSHVPHETGEPKSVHEQQASIDEYDSPSMGSQDRHSISSRERHHEKSHLPKKVNGPNKPAFAKLAELLEKDKPTMEEEVMKVLGLTEKKKIEKGSLSGSAHRRKNAGRPLRQKSQPIKENGPSSELSSLTDARADTRSSLFRSASDRKFNLDKTSQSEGLNSTIHGHDATGTETQPHSVRGSGPEISDGDLAQGMTRASSARQLFQLKDTAGEEKVNGEEQQNSTPIWKISNPKIREALGLDQPKSEEEEKSDDNVIDVEKAMQERPEKSGKVRGTRGCSRRKPKESGPSGSYHGEPSDDSPTPEEMGYEPTGGSMHSKPSMPATPSTPVQRLQRRGSTRALTKDDQSGMPQAPMTPVRHRMSRRGSTGGAVNFNGTGRSTRNLVQTRSRPAARECQTPRTDASPVNICLAKREPTNQSQSKRVSTPIRMRRRLSLAETSSSISDQLMSAFSFPSVDEPAKAGIPAALPLDNAESTHETPLNGDAEQQGDEEIQLSKVEKDAERLDDGNDDDDDGECDDDERIEEAVAKLSETEVAVGEPSESSDIEDERDSAADLLHDLSSMVDFARSQVAHPVCLPTPVRVNQVSLRSALETPTNMMMEIRKIKMAEVPFVSLVGMASKDQEMRVAEESTGESAAQTMEKMNQDESASDAAAVAAATDNKMGNKSEKYLSNLPNLYARMTSELSESTTRLNKARENVSALEAEVKELQRHLRTLQQHKWNL